MGQIAALPNQRHTIKECIVAESNSSTGAVIIDFAAARQARRSTAQPFQGRLLKAARVDGDRLAIVRARVDEGAAREETEITRSILRDQVRRNARSAL